MSRENSEHDSKNNINIVVLGASSVSKTSLIFRYVNEKCPTEHDPTVEDIYNVDFIKESLPYYLNILDTAGLEDYQNRLSTWIKSSDCFILVYSIDNEASFKELNDKYETISEIKDIKQTSIILVGNKCDKENERKVTKEEGEKYAKSKGLLFLETSSLDDNNNIKEIFDAIVIDYLKNSGVKKDEK